MRRFRLFPQERRWWSFADYEALLSVVERVRPTRILEFGPGGSTLALVEGGAAEVVTCEDDPRWLEAFRRDLAPHPVRMVPYAHGDPLTIPTVDAQRFDLGFVDGPRNTDTRGLEIAYAAARCDVVAAHDAHTAPVRAALEALGRPVEYVEFARTPHGDRNAIGVVTMGSGGVPSQH